METIAMGDYRNKAVVAEETPRFDNQSAAQHGDGADNRRAEGTSFETVTARAACGSSPGRYAEQRHVNQICQV